MSHEAEHHRGRHIRGNNGPSATVFFASSRLGVFALRTEGPAQSRDGEAFNAKARRRKDAKRGVGRREDRRRRHHPIAGRVQQHSARTRQRRSEGSERGKGLVDTKAQDAGVSGKGQTWDQKNTPKRTFLEPPTRSWYLLHVPLLTGCGNSDLPHYSDVTCRTLLDSRIRGPKPLGPDRGQCQ